MEHFDVVFAIAKTHGLVRGKPEEFQDGFHAFGFVGILEHDVDGVLVPTGAFAMGKMGHEKGFIEVVAEGDHLVNHPVIMVREGAWLGKTRSVFFMRGYDAFVNHVDVAFLLFNQG